MNFLSNIPDPDQVINKRLSSEEKHACTVHQFREAHTTVPRIPRSAGDGDVEAHETDRSFA